ncbi:putative PDF receptor variant 2 [Daphnia pulex]|uniref:Putative PDF receptor variant 2 n=1 Tax=Daphnia pulex TaxID=6669 RepID=E9FR28_DAPPU|nr:putative PDF receptor variant 2 [Daphnia pulex]|eukprot:EFX90264.1 putative PDF receptor variant 2 [Daphnia pulex]
MEQCRQLYQEAQRDLEETSQFQVFCRVTWDTLLCWPPTRPGETVHLPCPPRQGIDPTQWAERRCLDSGIWEGPPPSDASDAAAAAVALQNDADDMQQQGWTNYSQCFLPEIRDLMKRLDSGSGQDAENKLIVAQATRVLELTGLTVSLISLMISLFIFTYFRSLQNHRTRIHKNLFAAIGIQVIIRMTLYLDQAVFVSEMVAAARGIHETPILCEWFYIVLEYARTTMFVWMFIEGLFLHNLITVMVFRPDTYHKLYLALGWGIPIILTAIWAAFTATHQTTSACWLGYNLTPSYWILEGPRLTIIFINLLYLLNILRVLVTKLRNSQCSEAEQLRKSVKAAMVLLPLLGITNALVMIKAPLDRSVVEFALWSYSSHFLTSFQGFFVALLYCFLNGEVRSTLAKKMRNYLTDRQLGTSFLGFGPGSTRLMSQFANPSTQVETEREARTVLDDQQLQQLQPGSTAEKHPRHLLRASFSLSAAAQQHQDTSLEPINKMMTTTLV